MQEATRPRLVTGRDEQAPSGEDAGTSKGDSGRTPVKFISDFSLYPPLAESPDPDNATQLRILRKRVTEYWVDGVLKHSLYNEVLISLGKREVGNAVDAPWKYTVEVSNTTNSAPFDRDVSSIYDTTGSFLILGEPGSGKTTTLLDLARNLLERAKDDIRELVPVVVNLSSWKQKEPIADWISEELSEKYRVPRKTGNFWLQMFLRKGTASPAFAKEKVIGWLSWLAEKMRNHSQSVFLVEGLQCSVWSASD